MQETDAQKMVRLLESIDRRIGQLAMDVNWLKQRELSKVEGAARVVRQALDSMPKP